MNPPPSSASTASASTVTAVKKPKRSKPKSEGPLTTDEVGMTLDAVVHALGGLGYAFCLFGSAGCSMYGMDHRTPHDIDLVVLNTPHSTEDIKRRVVQRDRRFVLIPARNPQNKWKVMWYRLLTGKTQGRRCKVDILTPGLLNIPQIPLPTVFNVYSIPLMPFLCLLLLKLQGYFDHIESSEKRMKDKIPSDIEDIKQMARLGAEVYRVHIGLEWFDMGFRELAFRRVREFSKLVPALGGHWAAMGFEVVHSVQQTGLGSGVAKPV